MGGNATRIDHWGLGRIWIPREVGQGRLQMRMGRREERETISVSHTLLRGQAKITDNQISSSYCFLCPAQVAVSGLPSGPHSMKHANLQTLDACSLWWDAWAVRDLFKLRPAEGSAGSPLQTHVQVHRVGWLTMWPALLNVWSSLCLVMLGLGCWISKVNFT